MKTIKHSIALLIVLIPFILNGIAFVPLLKTTSIFFYIWSWIVTVIIGVICCIIAVKFEKWFDSKLK